MWDMVNIAYYQRGQPLLYGIATDDSHNYHLFGPQFSNAGRGWIMVQADSLNARPLLEAMVSGQFYATTGVVLESVSTANNTLEIEVTPEEGVTYKIDFIGVKDGATAETLKSIGGTTATFPLENIQFVRARITSDKLMTNPVFEDEFEIAWTQPVSAQK